MPQDEKTKAAFERIEQGVKDVYSSEKFKQYLSCLSKFHSYSFYEYWLVYILLTDPMAGVVKSFLGYTLME